MSDIKVTHLRDLVPPEEGGEIKFRCWDGQKMWTPEETLTMIGHLLAQHNKGEVRLLRKSFYTTGPKGNGDEIYEADIVEFELAEGIVDDDSNTIKKQGPHYGTIKPAGDGLGLFVLGSYGSFLFSPYVNLEAAVWLVITEIKGNLFEDMDVYAEIARG